MLIGWRMVNGFGNNFRKKQHFNTWKAWSIAILQYWRRSSVQLHDDNYTPTKQGRSAPSALTRGKCENFEVWTLTVFGPKIQIFTGGSKSFGTNITEKHLATLFALFFGRAWDQMGQNLRQNFAVLGPEIPILMGVSKSFGTHIMEKPPKQLVRIVFWSGIRSNGPKMPIFGPKCQFWAKFGRFWEQIQFFGGRE